MDCKTRLIVSPSSYKGHGIYSVMAFFMTNNYGAIAVNTARLGAGCPSIVLL